MGPHRRGATGRRTERGGDHSCGLPRPLRQQHPEHLRRPDPIPARHPECGFPPPERRSGQHLVPGSRHRNRVLPRLLRPEWRPHQRHSAGPDHRQQLRQQRRHEVHEPGRIGCVARFRLSELLGLQPERRPSRLRAVPWRPRQHRRRGLRLPIHRGHRHRVLPVRPRPDRNPRGGPLAQPPPHLGRWPVRLRRLRLGHPGIRRRQLRLCPRPRQLQHHRHGPELHGLLR